MTETMTDATPVKSRKWAFLLIASAFLGLVVLPLLQPAKNNDATPVVEQTATTVSSADVNAEFVSALSPLMDNVAANIEHKSDALNSHDIARFERLAGEADAIYIAIENLNPPRDYAESHRHLVEAVGWYRQADILLLDWLVTGKPAARGTATTQLDLGSSAMDRATAALPR